MHITCTMCHVHITCTMCHVHITCTMSHVHITCTMSHVHITCTMSLVHITCTMSHVHITCVFLCLFVVYVFIGEPDALVQFVRCLDRYANISLHTVIHVRGFDNKFDYNSTYALKTLTSFCEYFNKHIMVVIISIVAINS